MGGPEEVLRPVDGRLLQPGCFKTEWQEFFADWGWPTGGGLRECMKWGDCYGPELREWRNSKTFVWQRPSMDQAVLKHFCRSGFLLRAALQVHSLGLGGCIDDEDCFWDCDFVVRLYS